MSVQSLMENWDAWQNRIIAYSKLEMATRKRLKDIIGKLEGSSDDIKGWHNTIMYFDLAFQCCQDVILIYIFYVYVGILSIQMIEEFLIPKTRKERLSHFVQVRIIMYIRLVCVGISILKPECSLLIDANGSKLTLPCCLPDHGRLYFSCDR